MESFRIMFQQSTACINAVSYHRIRRFVLATRFPAAVTAKSIWYTEPCQVIFCGCFGEWNLQRKIWQEIKQLRSLGCCWINQSMDSNRQPRQPNAYLPATIGFQLFWPTNRRLLRFWTSVCSVDNFPWEWADWISQECGFPNHRPMVLVSYVTYPYEAYVRTRFLRKRVLGRIVTLLARGSIRRPYWDHIWNKIQPTPHPCKLAARYFARF